MKLVIAAAMLALGFAGTAYSQPQSPPQQPADAKAASATVSLADGEVRRVDKETSKITLRHGPIPNLDMPAMSMVFQVKDPALLDKVKAGDKVRFQAEKAGGQYVVTHIEAVQ